MPRGVWLAAGLCAAACLRAEQHCTLGAPCYSEAGIVNGASFEAGAVAPNTIISIFGTGLSFSTRAIAPEDISAGILPVELPGTGVRVMLDHMPAQIYYVSPLQVNLLVPSNLRAVKVKLQLVRDGTAGPPIWLQLKDAAPALFLLEPGVAIATHADFSLITADAPATAREVVILWATGLGPTVPPAEYGRVPTQAAWIERIADFQVLLGGTAISSDRILYAGTAPYFAGLYQINVRLPEVLEQDPEVRVAVGDSISPAGVRLSARPGEANQP